MKTSTELQKAIDLIDYRRMDSIWYYSKNDDSSDDTKNGTNIFCYVHDVLDMLDEDVNEEKLSEAIQSVCQDSAPVYYASLAEWYAIAHQEVAEYEENFVYERGFDTYKLIAATYEYSLEQTLQDFFGEVEEKDN